MQNTELVTGNSIQNSFFVQYCQSENTKLIQLADVFSNIYYCNLISKDCYKDEIENMIKEGYIKCQFKFPL